MSDCPPDIGLVPLSGRVVVGEKVARTHLHAHRGGDGEDAPHLTMGQVVGVPLFTDRMRLDARRLGQPGLGAEALGRSEVVDDVIGHVPIISDEPIIASPDLSGARRYSSGHKVGMNLGLKLKAERKRLGMTQAALGERLKVGQSTISDLERGGLQSWHVHRDALAKIFNRPRSFFEPQEGEVSDELPEDSVHADLPDSVSIPEYDVRLSAGGGFVVDRESTRRHWALPRFLVEDRLGVRASQATVQEVVGDSMEPTLSSGDYVLIDLNDRRLGLPGVFAVWDGDALVCKRLERVPGTEPSEVRLKSDNPLHGEYRVAEDRVRVIGRVRWVTRRM